MQSSSVVAHPAQGFMCVELCDAFLLTKVAQNAYLSYFIFYFTSFVYWVSQSTLTSHR